MKGNNEIILNTATMMSIVQEYVDKYGTGELLRLVGDLNATRLSIETFEAKYRCMRERAERAEAELAALKTRIFEGIVLDVDDLALGHAGLPSEWRGKRVRLVVEE